MNTVTDLAILPPLEKMRPGELIVLIQRQNRIIDSLMSEVKRLHKKVRWKYQEQVEGLPDERSYYYRKRDRRRQATGATAAR